MLTRVDAEALLDALDPEQREVALASRGPVCVLAGAGTGKTRAITHRIAYGVYTGLVDPVKTLALTFTVRAAGELRGRLRELGVESVRASTFHAAALRQLTYFWPRVVGGRPPKLVESKIPMLREAARDMRLDSATLADTASEIEWAKVCQIRPADYPALAAAAGRTPAGGLEQAGRLFEGYERLRRERQLIDFESVLELTAAMIFAERRVADQVQDTYRYFTVDEYQDVSPLQKLLLDAWLGDRDELCVVGDPHQTIYTFAGATPAYLRGFTQEFPEARVVRLVRDYRSSPQVVTVANRVIDAGLVAQRRAGPDPVLAQYPTDVAEAAGVASVVSGLAAHAVPYREIAILLRINAHTERFERALAEAQIPYVVRGAERFYDRPEVKEALVLLRGASVSPGGNDPPQTPPALGGVAHPPKAPRGRGKPSGDTALAREVRHILGTAGLTAAPPEGRGRAREKWESLTAIAQLAADSPGMSLGDFAAELSRRAEIGHAPVPEAVTLATMHAAKGLEWDAVLLPSLAEGIIPIVYARTQDAIEEERRLLYVAVTRAREHLVLSWAQASGKRSRFWADLTRARA
jgi:DNA helicase II / ATP-dependent DNA helicase PcrA